jgi:hypothetical protein
MRYMGVVKSFFTMPAACSNFFTASSTRPSSTKASPWLPTAHYAQYIIINVGLLVVGDGQFVITFLQVDGSQVHVGELAARGTAVLVGDGLEAGPLVVAVQCLVQRIDLEVVLRLSHQLTRFLGLGLSDELFVPKYTKHDGNDANGTDHEGHLVLFNEQFRAAVHFTQVHILACWGSLGYASCSCVRRWISAY